WIEYSFPKQVVGGNPGREYLMTRHSLGFLVIDRLAQKLGVKLTKEKSRGLYYKTDDYILLKPQTYMNSSGECISVFMNFWRIPKENLLVIYDDIALPLGQFRYREQGSSGGYNGMKNIIENLGTDEFKRLRVVLGKFSLPEKAELKKVFPLLVDGYYLLEPSSLIPQNDPSLLWINSGVATLKKYFNNPKSAPARNMANCQRVIRTDDLANINAQSYHQTLFEMLGNFSIGNMGDGPCGPNTEIYYDFQVDGTPPKKITDLDSKRFLEISNTVFPELYHKGTDYLPLAEKCVDTGAGLERIAM
ncbi:774_t:CDS:2, partial [Funneliformis geosporum]